MNYYTNEKNIQIIIALLKAHGIKRVIASPGTTNVGFLGSIEFDPWFQVWSAVDERHATYMACGMAYESGEPVVLTCTGASAARNYLPGLTEAFYRKLPILALTTTSKSISRTGNLFGQQLDHSVLPKDAARYSAQCRTVLTDEQFHACERLVNEAILELFRHGGGPVHLNYETTFDTSFLVENLPSVRKMERHFGWEKSLPPIASGSRIIIAVGAHKSFSESAQKALEQFARTYDAVVLCDSTSSYSGSNRISSSLLCSQRIGANPAYDKLKPDLIIHIGEICNDYPIGAWAIRNFLTIPPDRVADCIWVFRFTCLTCFVGMVNVPFGAMYGAKQYIAELTIYSYFTSTANAVFLYYMITHPGVWLLKYALWSSVLSVLPNLIICIRAIWIFPECRIRRRYLWDMRRIREVGSFGWWNLLGTICALLRVQGVNVLINKCFGATVNAAMALGSSVNGHCSALTSSLLGAFAPAVTTAYGAGETGRMKALSYRMCKFGCVLLLIFLIPLLSELKTVMILWLKNPPPYATYLCAVMLIQTLLEVVTHGHMVAVNASGRVKEYQLSMTKISILTLPAAIITVMLGGGVYALGIVLICVRLSISLRRVYYARLFAGLSARVWLKDIVLPLAFVILVAGAASLVPRLVMAPSFGRIVVTTIFCELILLPMLWLVILDNDERDFVRERFLNRISSKVGLLRGDKITHRR